MKFNFSKFVLLTAGLLASQVSLAASFACVVGNMPVGSVVDDLGYAKSYVAETKSEYKGTDLSIRYVEGGKVLQVMGTLSKIKISMPVSMEIEYPQEGLLQGSFTVGNDEVTCSYQK